MEALVPRGWPAGDIWLATETKQFRWTCYQQQSCCCCCHSSRTRVWRPTRCSCLNISNCCSCRVPACCATITTTTVYATRAEAVEDSYFQVGASLRDFCGGQEEREGRGGEAENT